MSGHRSVAAELAPIRLLYFLNSPGVPGGVEEHVAELARRLPDDRFAVTVVCPTSCRPFFEPLARSGRRVLGLDLYRPRHLLAMRRLVHLLRAEAIDIVHSHQFMATMYAAPLARLAGVPIVVETPHLREAWRRGWLKRSHLIDRLVYTMVDRFVAVSRANERHLIEGKGCRPDRIVQIYNGRDLSAFSPDAGARARTRVSLRVTAGELLIVDVGRLAEQKGHRHLLDAYASVRRQVSGARMAFVGDGELRADLERLVRERGWGADVLFTGYQSAARDFLAAADIAVLPSLYEGLPLVAVEAGAMGRPMVASDVDGTPEVVLDGVTGLLVPPADPGRLARALIELAGDPARRERMGAAAREFVVGRFGIEQHVAQHAAFYTSLITRPRAAAVGSDLQGRRGQELPVKLLRTLSYQPGIVRLVRGLGLQQALSALYFRLNRPPDGIWRRRLHGVSGAFEVRTARQLRWLESLQVNSDLDPDLKALMAAAHPGDVVYDIGANMGFFSIMLGHRVGATGLVVSFEPQTQAFEHLRTNIRLNGLQNVRAFRNALGADSGAAFVHIAKENVLSRLQTAADSATGPRERVDAVVEDDLVKAEELPVPRLVKIDVEGAEYGVIRGLSRTLSHPSCQMVCCEIHPPLLPSGVTQDTVLVLLRDLGFDEVEVHEFGTWSVAVCRREPA